MPCTIWRKVHGRPVIGSSKDSSHFGQAYFVRTGSELSSCARRAFKASAMAGRSSRVSVAIVSSTLTSRPFTFLMPNRLGELLKNILADHGALSCGLR